MARCAVCGKPYAAAKEVDYARRVLKSVGGPAAADVGKLDECLACRRREDARAFQAQARTEGGAR